MRTFGFTKLLPWGTLLSLCWLALSCSSGPLQSFSRKDSRSSLDAEGSESATEEEPGQVPAALSLVPESENLSPAMSLLARIESAEFAIESCRSGFQMKGRLPQDANILLYAFDQACQAKILGFRLGGEDYILAKGLSFDSRTGAVNPFLNRKGNALFVVVAQQLASKLDPKGIHGARFLIAENAEGKQWSIDFYELIIVSDRTQLIEGSSEFARISIRRQKPAKGRLTVPLVYEGSATPGQDTTALPRSIVLESGQEEASFPVQALADANVEAGGETLKISLAPQSTYYTKGIPVQLTILDKSGAQLVLDRGTIDFGTRARVLPHKEYLRLENKGSSPASQIRLANLRAPFSLPGGFPGDGGTCGTTIPAKSSCLIAIGLSSASRQHADFDAQIQFYDGLKMQTLPLRLSGATRYAADLRGRDSNQMEWGEIGSSSYKIKSYVLKNMGQTTARAIEANIEGSNFRFVGGTYPGRGGNCGRELAAKAVCTLSLETALIAEGSYESKLKVSYWNRFQKLTLETQLKAQKSPLAIAEEVHIIGKDQAYSASVRLLAGQIATTRFELVEQPLHGSLKLMGKAWSYIPAKDYTGHDSFALRALDANGPSASVRIQVKIAPKALVLSRGCNRERQGEEIADFLQKKGFYVQTMEASRYTYSLVPFYDLIVITDSLRDRSDVNLLKKLGTPLMTTSFWAAKQLDMVNFRHDQEDDAFESAFAYETAQVMADQTLAPARRLYVPLDHHDLQRPDVVLSLGGYVRWLMQEPLNLLSDTESRVVRPGVRWKHAIAFQDRGLFSWKMDLSVPKLAESPEARIQISLGRCDRMSGEGPPGEGKLIQIEVRSTQTLEILWDMDHKEYTLIRNGIRSSVAGFAPEAGIDCIQAEAFGLPAGNPQTSLPKILPGELRRFL